MATSSVYIGIRIDLLAFVNGLSEFWLKRQGLWLELERRPDRISARKSSIFTVVPPTLSTDPSDEGSDRYWGQPQFKPPPLTSTHFPLHYSILSNQSMSVSSIYGKRHSVIHLVCCCCFMALYTVSLCCFVNRCKCLFTNSCKFSVILICKTAVPQPPYSPDLAPADFFLFPKLKSSPKGCRFQRVEETEENSIRDLRAIPQNTFQDAFQN